MHAVRAQLGDAVEVRAYESVFDFLAQFHDKVIIMHSHLFINLRYMHLLINLRYMHLLINLRYMHKDV